MGHGRTSSKESHTELLLAGREMKRRRKAEKSRRIQQDDVQSGKFIINACVQLRSSSLHPAASSAAASVFGEEENAARG